jgi:hypothetical protein
MRLFSMHPGLQKDLISAFRKMKTEEDIGKRFDLFKGKTVSLDEFFNPLRPEVYVIPADRHIWIVEDKKSCEVAAPIYFLPFSKSRFYIDEDCPDGIFSELLKTSAFWRLADINQLGFLIPPRPAGKEDLEIHFYFPVFPHSRFIHSMLVAAMGYVILGRSGFDKDKIAGAVLTLACHDIATPAGGDSIQRIDPEGLDEEKNFSYVLKKHGLDKKWKEIFGFDLEKAQEWVEGKRLIGDLLDKLDKISYTALDCFELRRQRPGKVKSFTKLNPTVMDVWEDIRLENEHLYFVDPDRLYNFLILRALEFNELLYAGFCRTFDYLLYARAKHLYEKGVITKDSLLEKGDTWLKAMLDVYNAEIDFELSPDDILCLKFKSEKRRNEFARKCAKFVEHIDYVEKFDSGLNWKVMHQGKIMPLRKAISKRKEDYLENLATSIEGWYVYYKKK